MRWRALLHGIFEGDFLKIAQFARLKEAGEVVLGQLGFVLEDDFSEIAKPVCTVVF